jgi:hypothetical protein
MAARPIKVGCAGEVSAQSRQQCEQLLHFSEQGASNAGADNV